MTNWHMLLEQAEEALLSRNWTRAFCDAFNALETCYCQAAGFDVGEANDRFGEAVKALADKRQINADEKSLAQHLGKARNVVFHKLGFEPSERETRRTIDRVKKLCAKFGTTVSHVMSTPVECAKTTDELEHSLRMMKDRGYSYIPVVDASGRAVGTLMESNILDALRREQGMLDLKTPVEALMQKEVFPSIRPNATLAEAGKLMKTKKTNALLVLTGGKPTGILTVFDLIG